MASSLRPFSLGWHPVEPGPGPRSDLLDQPPGPASGNLVAAHQRWRSAIEADEARLLAHQFSGPLWHPVPLPAQVNVVPVYGGTPQAIEQVVTTLVMSGMQSGRASCRVVNLSGWDVSATLRSAMGNAKRNRAQFEVVGTGGSSVDLFGNPNPKELLALLVDALRISEDRSAGRQAQQQRQELEKVAQHLRGSVTLDRLIAAIDVALGVTRPGSGLSVDEVRDLQDYGQQVVSPRRSTKDRLEHLQVDLEALRGFNRTPGMAPDVVGAGRLSIRWFDVDSGVSTDEIELGRQLVARAVLQTFTRAGTDEVLVVVGAERLSDEVRDEMVTAAQRHRKCLVLLYTQINDAGQRMLGFAGSSVALFLKMPNPHDAQIAAEYLGREYKFVVNGISIAEGQTKDWSDAYGTSTSHGTSRSRTSTSSSGYGGGAFNFSRSVGSSVSSSLERGSTQTQSHGGSTSTTTTTSAGRVQEYVVEPTVFQTMPDDVMMIVGSESVTIASCHNSLRSSRQTSTSYVAIP